MIYRTTILVETNLEAIRVQIDPDILALLQNTYEGLPEMGGGTKTPQPIGAHII
jgi:hypothetical protein